MYVVERTRIEEDSTGQEREVREYLPNDDGWAYTDWVTSLENAFGFASLTLAAKKILTINPRLKEKKNIRIVKVKKTFRFYLDKEGNREEIGFEEYQDYLLSLHLVKLIPHEDTQEKT